MNRKKRCFLFAIVLISWNKCNLLTWWTRYSGGGLLRYCPRQSDIKPENIKHPNNGQRTRIYFTIERAIYGIPRASNRISAKMKLGSVERDFHLPWKPFLQG